MTPSELKKHLKTLGWSFRVAGEKTGFSANYIWMLTRAKTHKSHKKINQSFVSAFDKAIEKEKELLQRITNNG